MSICADMRRAIAAARAERASKRSLGFAVPQLVVIVGNWSAYCADRIVEAKWPKDGIALADLVEFEGVPVEVGSIGVRCEWRAR